MSLFDIFKSPERRCYEAAVRSGMNPRRAEVMSRDVRELRMSGSEAQAFGATRGNKAAAYNRADGAKELGLTGLAKDVYLATGDKVFAYQVRDNK